MSLQINHLNRDIEQLVFIPASLLGDLRMDFFIATHRLYSNPTENVQSFYVVVFLEFAFWSAFFTPDVPAIHNTNTWLFSYIKLMLSRIFHMCLNACVQLKFGIFFFKSTMQNAGENVKTLLYMHVSCCNSDTLCLLLLTVIPG